MEFELRDGRGTGRRLSVNSLNRAETESVTFDREDDAIQRGVGYQISSGPITYTSGGVASGVLYFKNVEDVDVVLDRVVLMIGTSTSGTVSGDWTHKILRNPDSGTLISNASPAGISNSNHGSSNILNEGLEIFKGAEGSTIAGGTGAPLPVQQTNNRIVFPIGRRIPKGSSFAIEITAPALSGGASVISVSVAHVFLDTNLIR